ncbi:hypothetical protein HDV04_002291, partial [Boothiomyces sp. JEL0838]
MWYYYGASVFFFSFLFALLARNTSKTREKQELANVLLLVDGIAGISYILMALRLSPQFKDANYYPVDTVRYLEWVCTCPNLIALVGEITKNREIAAKTARYDYVLLVFGFLGAITREPFSTVFCFFAVMNFMYVIYGLNTMFLNGMEGKNGCRLDPLSLNVARICTIGIPTTFFSVKYNLISFVTGEVTFTMIDIVAKVFLTLVLVNATVEQAQNERVDELSGIATNMEKELGNADALLERM